MLKHLLLILSLGVCYFGKATDVSVIDYGAKGDSTTLNSASIQKAIDHCSASGGGKVIFPSGCYLSGTIVLKNNVTLSLQKGAVLLGSTDVNDYQNLDPFADGLGTETGWAFVVAIDANNISIEGEGAIDGQGAKLKARQILTDDRPEGKRWGRRPFLLRLVRCSDIKIKGVKLYYSAAWTTHYFQCKKLLIEGVKLVSHGIAHNDGFDIDGCQDVRIKDCDIESGDDALCFKTTSSKMACRNIIVSGLRLKSNQGAIKMGTESMADFENISISDCYIYQTKNGGIKLLTVDGAHLRNVTISDIKMDDVRTPILVRLGARLSVFRKGQDTKQSVGSLENVIIRNVKAKAADSAQLKPPSGILITGIPGHNISNLTLENIEIDLLGSGTREHAAVTVPEAIDQYPEVKTFGPTIPAYGLWARHVQGLKLNRVSFRLKQNDLRPALFVEDGKDIVINNVMLPATTGSDAIIRLKNVETARVENTVTDSRAASFIKLEGKNNEDGIIRKGNKAKYVDKEIIIVPSTSMATAQ